MLRSARSRAEGQGTMEPVTRILLVDDEQRILEVFSLMLREAGYSVRTASHAEEALSAAAGDRFDVAVIDQFLGLARGLDLMQELSARDPDLAAVIMTANGTTDLAVEALKGGASDFITKPFLLGDLIKSIEFVQKKRELERQQRALFATLERKVEEKTEELRRIYLHVLASLAQAMEKKDTGTYGHSRRVSYHVRLIAAAMDLGVAEREDLKAAALLHDIGKIGITDFILGKNGPLSDGEMDVIKSHPRKGVEILKPLTQFERMLPSILNHHEQYDGSGYPDGIAGEAIPLHARIIAIADTYDAILSSRPYRAGTHHEAAIRELVACSGRQFDPSIVKAFVEADAHYRRIFCEAGHLPPAQAI